MSTDIATAARIDITTIADLMIAEVAAQRQAPELSANYYYHQAMLTGDLAVLRQATLLNFYLSQHERSVALGEAWLAQAPEEQEALQLTAISALLTDRNDYAASLMERLLVTGGSEGLLGLFRHTHNLDSTNERALITAMNTLHEAHPNEPVLLYANALYWQLEDDDEQALRAVKRANRRLPQHLESQLLEAELLFSTGRERQGHRHYRRLMNRDAENRQVRVHYFRQLVASGDTEDARNLIKQSDHHDPAFRLGLALVATEAESYDLATELFTQLLDDGHNVNEVLLYLAHIAEKQGRLRDAVNYLQGVRGHRQLRAQVQAARIEYLLGNHLQGRARIRQLEIQFPELAQSLMQAEIEILKDLDPAAAQQLISDRLAHRPNDVRLRYQRALIAARQGDVAAMEIDLKHILSINPDDPAALNAWGYTLADLNIRLDEALGYIKKALAQRPDDPAIQDSMGWVLYRLERHQEALLFLRKAHAAYPDPEITVHLAQVLTALGKHSEAIALVEQQLQTHPDSSLLMDLLETLQRR